MKRHLSTFETILTQPSREFIYIFVFYHVITSRYSMSVSEGATCQNALLNNDEIQNQGLKLFLLPERHQTTQIPALSHRYLHKSCP